MKFMLFNRMLFLVSFWNALYAQNKVQIERRVMIYNTSASRWMYQPDTFKLPSGTCIGDGSAQCRSMGSHASGSCTCECTIERATFGFYNDQWKCIANSRARKYGGCSLILLRNRTEDSPIATVPKTVQSNIPFEMSTDLQRCYIIPYNSMYLKCDETWEKLDNNFVFDRFSTKGNNQAQFFVFNNTTRSHRFHYEVKEGSIMRMTIGCYNKSNAIIPNCLLLKMQGAIECPNFAMLPSLKPATVTSMLIPPIRAAKTAKPISTNIPHPLNHSSVPSSTPRKITNARHSQSTTVTSPSSFGKDEKGATREGSNIDLIAGTAAGVIGLILIIVAIVIIIRRRQKR